MPVTNHAFLLNASHAEESNRNSKVYLKILTLYSILYFRITRYPLLISAILQRLETTSGDFELWNQSLNTLNKLVQDCNEATRSKERMEELLILSQQLDFREVRALPLISASRWLVKKGEAIRFGWKETSEAKLTFGRSRVSKQTLFFFLFTDLLVITKRKG